MTRILIANTKPRAERPSKREYAGAIVYVTMPCCGTTRGLHDDSSEPVKRDCRKCGARWMVTYLGAGRFKFSKRHA